MDNPIVFTHKDLIEKSKLGDRKTQYKLYSLYVDAMFNVSIRIVKIKEDAEDVVQDSFIDAFKHLETFKYQSTFGSWLKKIVVNKSINYLKVKRIPLVNIDDQDYWINDAEEINETKQNTLDINKIKTAINTLPRGYQTIINLYLIEGYDHNEIGEILEISVSTSKSQYHRAKKKLVELIN